MDIIHCKKKVILLCKRKMSKKIFIIIVGIVFVVVSLSIFILFKKNVGGFDTLFISQGNCTPFNLFVSKGEMEYSAKIVWETKGECMGFVQYGLNKEDLDRVGIDVLNGYKGKKHEIVLEKLLTKEKYFFLINSDGEAFGNNGRPLELVLSNL